MDVGFVGYRPYISKSAFLRRVPMSLTSLKQPFGKPP